MILKKGDVVVCALAGDYGKPRPAIVAQSNLFNETHASITLCPVTSHLTKAPLFRLTLKPTASNGLACDSQIMVDKMTTIKREKITQCIGRLTRVEMNQLHEALKLWFGLDE